MSHPANPHQRGSTAWLVVEERRLRAEVERITAERDEARRLHSRAVAEARDIDRGRILGGVTCTRHGEPVEIDVCSCPKGWLENRAWAIRAEKERDEAREEVDETAAVARAQVEKLNGDVAYLQDRNERDTESAASALAAAHQDQLAAEADRDAERAKFASLYTGLELTLRDALPDGLHLPHFRDAVDFAANELRDNRAGIVWRQAALDALADRISTTADEAFGPFPVQPADENLTAIERGIFAMRQERDAAIRERDELREALRRERAGLEPLAPAVAPDDAAAEVVAVYVAECAEAWAPGVRLVGNARAGDIARAIRALLVEQRQLVADLNEERDEAIAASGGV